MAGQTLAPVSSVVFTTTGGAGNVDTVTFSADGDYVELVADPANTGRVSLTIDPGVGAPTIDGDGTLTLFPGGALLEPSRVRGNTVVKATSAAAGQRLAVRVVSG